MTGQNFTFFTGNLALSSTKYVQDGSDIIHFLSSMIEVSSMELAD